MAPALAYGSSGEHAAFPGTLSVGQDVVELTLLELIRSADAFAGAVIVSPTAATPAGGPGRRPPDRRGPPGAGLVAAGR